MNKLILFICSLSLFAFKSNSQTLQQALEHFSDSLISNKCTDTVFEFTNHIYAQSGPPDYIMLSDSSKFSTSEEAILFYKQNSKWSLILFSSGMDYNSAKSYILKSSNFQLPKTSIIDSIRYLSPKIENDYFLNFTVKIEKNNNTGFSEVQVNHSPTYTMSVYNASNSFSKNIDEYAIMRTSFRPNDVNVNFEYNKSLHLYSCFFLMKQLYNQYSFTSLNPTPYIFQYKETDPLNPESL